MKLSNNSAFNFDFGNETLVFLKFTNVSSRDSGSNKRVGVGLSLS